MNNYGGQIILQRAEPIYFVSLMSVQYVKHQADYVLVQGSSHGSVKRCLDEISHGKLYPSADT